MVMDRAGWLWRRKSSDKSPGGSDSSLSVSSHSEHCSDNQVQHHALICVLYIFLFHQYSLVSAITFLLHDNVLGVYHNCFRIVVLFSCMTLEFPREEVS